MRTIDIESCGLYGAAVLLQHAKDDGPVSLYDLWRRPAGETLALIEEIALEDVCGFNLAFDWFHMCKLYTMLLAWDRPDRLPKDYIDDLAAIEHEACFGPCLKPRRACDIFLHARKGPYQSLMARKDIKIKRVPAVLAQALAEELEKRIEIDNIYFSRKKDKYAPNWAVYDIPGETAFKNVALKFAASGALKVLAEHVLKIPKSEILKFTDIEVDRKFWPKECGWAPFARANSKGPSWKVFDGKKHIGYSWPRLIHHHIEHWAFNDLARKYATNDVVFTRRLWNHPLFGCPEPGDDDSELACMVAATRWHGMSMKIPDLKKVRNAAITRQGEAPISPKKVKYYIEEVMDETTKLNFTSTKKTKLEEISRMKCDCSMDPEYTDSCPCAGTKVYPPAQRAQAVLDARMAKKQIEIFDKLIQSDRFHPSFVVIGTLSSRMAGADRLNPQGINSNTEVRECFDFADAGYNLGGGDFDAFEVVIADAIYDDEDLRKAITTIVPCARCETTGQIFNKKKGCMDKCDVCDGEKFTSQKIHALFAMELFPGNSYDDIVRSKGTKKDMYKIGKSGVFAMIYGGDWNTLVVKQGIVPEVAQRAERGFQNRFPGIKRARQRIVDSFCSMRQPGGMGTKVVWKDPAEFVESIFGFRRYFTLENKITTELFKMAADLPPSWRDLKIRVERHTGKNQTVAGATSSALYGAAFGIQGQNMRAAANHEIQSSGATITKRVQRKAWDLQPCGVNPFRLYGINVHDEVLFCVLPEFMNAVKEVVDATVETFREKVPLIKFEFKTQMASWASKG